MSTIIVDTLTGKSTATTLTIGSTPVVSASANSLTIRGEGSNQTSIQQGLIKQWVRTSGAAVTVADSFNTASVTDSGTGLYAPQFTTNMGNTNYAVLSSSDDKQDGGSIFVHNINDAVDQATSGYGTSNKKFSYALADGNQNIASAALGDLA
jgi:hypothetical protein